jgi:hypothetical protein
MATVDRRRLALRRNWSHVGVGAELHMTHCERSVRHVEVKHTIGWTSPSVPQPCLNHLREANTVRDLCRQRRGWIDFFSVQSHCGNEASSHENGGIRLFFVLLIIRAPSFTAGLRPPMLKTGTAWCRLRLKISVGPYRKAVQQHSRTSCTSQPGREEAQKHSVHNKTL